MKIKSVCILIVRTSTSLVRILLFIRFLKTVYGRIFNSTSNKARFYEAYIHLPINQSE